MSDNRPSWDDYCFELAKQVSTRSKDPSTHVGCVVVTDDKCIVSTGYNGIPRGVEDLPSRMERPAKYMWTAHAEENAVAMAARHGARLLGATAYITHYPCSRCARTLIQAGIACVRIDDGVTNMSDEEFDVACTMFEEAGVIVDGR